MNTKPIITKITAACAGILLSAANQAHAQQDNAAFNAGVKTAQQDAQFVQGVQASANEAKLQAALSADGVNGIEYGPDNKTMLRCLITVHTPLPTSMQPAYAKKSARTSATLASKTIFANYLKANCSDRVTEQGHEIVQNTGTDANGGTAIQESVNTKATTTFSESSAQAVCRGIISITEQVDPASGELISVFGWSVKSAGGAVSAEAVNNQAGANSPAQAQSAPPTQAAPQGNPIKSLKLEKAKAAGISDF